MRSNLHGKSLTPGSMAVGGIPLLEVLIHLITLGLGVPLAWWQIGVVALLAMPLAVFAAVFDVRELRSRGFHSVPSCGLVIATPLVYLIARARLLGSQDFDSLRAVWFHIGFCVLAVVVGGLTYVFAGLSYATATNGY